MGWLRERSRPAAWIALLALVLQLALAFGHVHSKADHPAAAVANVAGHEGKPQQPGDDHQDSYCAVYAVLTLLACAQVATAPVVPAQVALAAPVVPAATGAVRVGPPHRAYQSRAPPRA
jgi:hypothetical protein